MKLLVVGFDGADYRLCREYLPISCVELHAPIPYTVPSWVSIYTGLPVHKHEQRSIPGKWPDYALPFWQWFGKAGLRCGIFMAPASTPSNREHMKDWVPGGWYVSGWRTWAPGPIRPKLIPATLAADLPEGFEQGCDEFVSVSGGDELAAGKDLAALGFHGMFELSRRVLELRLGTFAALVKKRPVDVGFLALDVIDHWGHAYDLGIEREGLTAPYALTAYAIEKLWVEHSPEHLVVVSDHGFQYACNHTRMGVLGWRSEALPKVVPYRRVGNCQAAAFLSGLLCLTPPPHVARSPYTDGQWTAHWLGPSADAIYTAEEAEKIRKRLEKQGYIA